MLSLSSSCKKKRKKNDKRNIFSAISQLESEDVKASKVRRTFNEKAIAQSQANLQSQLIECRILLQQVLVQQQQRQKQQNSNDDSNDEKWKQKCISNCDDILSYLLEAKRKLYHQGDIDDNSDDEDDDNNHYTSIVKEQNDFNLEDLLQSEYEKCQNNWKEVLNCRHADLQLSTGLKTKRGSSISKQFRVMDQSFWDQWAEYVQSQHRWIPTTSQFDSKNDEETDLSFLWYDDSKLYQHIISCT